MLAATLILSVLASTSTVPWGRGESRGEDLSVTLVTFGPGDELPAWWGHTALVVTDAGSRQSRLYNYGMFGFSTGFVHKFVQGRLEFWVEDTPAVVGTYDLYRHYDRSVHLQELNLTPEQSVVLARLLADNVLEENRDYLYQHYNDNCSTRPRDLIDRALGGQLLEASKAPARMSLRELTRLYSQVSVPMSLVLDYLQNNELDRPITRREEAFLPDELERHLDELQLKRDDGTVVPAVRRKMAYWESKTRTPVPKVAPDWRLGLFLFGSALGGLFLGLGHLGRSGKRLPRVALGMLHALLGLGWGFLGVFLFVVGIWTDHSVAHHNENLFLINPVTFALFPLGVMQIFGRRRAVGGLRRTWYLLAAILMVGMACKALPMFNQQNLNLMLLVAPVTICGAALSWLTARAQKP